MLNSFKTIKCDEIITYEITEKKSKFIAHLSHVDCIDDAVNFINNIKEENKCARHNVSAYLLSCGEERALDDGEPAHTAGLPTLEQLKSGALLDVCCVTTRYFGGILLGTGGLTRAYDSTAKGAIDKAFSNNLVYEICSIIKVAICVPYSLHDRIVSIIYKHSGKLIDRTFSDEVQIVAKFKSENAESFVLEVNEVAGRDDICTIHEPIYGEF